MRTMSENTNPHPHFGLRSLFCILIGIVLIGSAAPFARGDDPDNCLSCHIAAGANVHLMLKSENPASSVSPVRLANTCRTMACHPGADVRLSAAGVHLDLPTIRGTLEF